MKTTEKSKFVKHTSQSQFFNGIPVTNHNKTDEVDTGSEHWYISHSSNSGDYGCKTTALVLGQMEYFLILKGDHRQGFQDCIDDPGRFPKTRLDACLEYVRANRDQFHERFSNPII